MQLQLLREIQAKFDCPNDEKITLLSIEPARGTHARYFFGSNPLLSQNA